MAMKEIEVESINIGLPNKEMFQGKEITTGICSSCPFRVLEAFFSETWRKRQVIKEKKKQAAVYCSLLFKFKVLSYIFVMLKAFGPLSPSTTSKLTWSPSANVLKFLKLKGGIHVSKPIRL
jgi:hypothetical protein